MLYVYFCFVRDWDYYIILNCIKSMCQSFFSIYILLYILKFYSFLHICFFKSLFVRWNVSPPLSLSLKIGFFEKPERNFPDKSAFSAHNINLFKVTTRTFVAVQCLHESNLLLFRVSF